MSVEENKAVVRKLEEALNAGRLEGIARCRFRLVKVVGVRT